MKIAMVDPWMFSPPYDRALCAGLLAHGHEVVLFRDQAADGHEGAGAIPEQRLFQPPPAWLPRVLALPMKGVCHVLGMLRLWRALQRFQPDVIHLQWMPLPLLDALFLPLLRKIAPVVHTVHDSNPYNGAGPWLLRAGHDLAIERSDHLIVHNELSEQRLRAQGVSSSRISKIPHGLLDKVPGATAGADRAPPDQRVRFLLFGKLKPYKGADLLIEAVARLEPEIRAKMHVAIVGKPYMPTAPLIERIKQADLSGCVDLRFDFVSDVEMDKLFEQADVLVFPYRGIDTSGVLMAAIARATPVIASNIGCFLETLVDGREALLVPPEDRDALAHAMREMVLSPVKRQAMRAAMTTLRDLIPSWQQIGAMTIEAYSRARHPGGLRKVTSQEGHSSAA